jgi:hypothetical protein
MAASKTNSQIYSKLDDIEDLAKDGFSSNQAALDVIHLRLDKIDKCIDDHELRIRTATEGVTQFKFFSGGSGLLSLVAFISHFFTSK